MNILSLKPSVLSDLTIRRRPWRPGPLRGVMQDLAGMDEAAAEQLADALMTGRVGIVMPPELPEMNA